MSRKIKTNVTNWFIRVLLLFGLVMMFGLKLMIHFKVDLLMRDVRLLEVKRNQLISERERMIAEVNRLKNIDRISRIAEEKLGLTTDPEPVLSIRLEDFKKVKEIKEKFARQQNTKTKDYQMAGIK